MLTHPTLDQLRALKLDGMAEAFIELQPRSRAKDLGHAEWLALLLDREAANRNTRRFQTRLRARQAAPRPGVASRMSTTGAPRRLDKALFQQLATCRWIAEHRNLARHRPVRRRQVVAGLRAGAESLPRRLHRALRTRAAAVCRSRAGAW